MPHLAPASRIAMGAGARDAARDDLIFDRATGAIENASLLQKGLIRLIQFAGRTSAAWSYRGFGLVCRAIRKLTASRTITVTLNDDAKFSFPFADRYWSILLDRTFHYEDDIEALFRASSDVPYTLVDCGANFGYWSVLISSRPFGAQRVIAIEPSARTFAILSNNASVNRTGFECVNMAVGGSNGIARLSGSKHESMTIAADAAASGEEINVIALDSLLDDGRLAPTERTVLKLDVEALEIETLNGATRLLRGDCVAICEDHGNDRTHSVSRHILQNTELKLFCFNPQINRYIELTDVSPLDRIKRFHNRGYNVIATSSAFWETRIRAA